MASARSKVAAAPRSTQNATRNGESRTTWSPWRANELRTRSYSARRGPNRSAISAASRRSPKRGERVVLARSDEGVETAAIAQAEEDRHVAERHVGGRRPHIGQAAERARYGARERLPCGCTPASAPTAKRAARPWRALARSSVDLRMLGGEAGERLHRRLLLGGFLRTALASPARLPPEGDLGHETLLVVGTALLHDREPASPGTGAASPPAAASCSRGAPYSGRSATSPAKSRSTTPRAPSYPPSRYTEPRARPRRRPRGWIVLSRPPLRSSPLPRRSRRPSSCARPGVPARRRSRARRDTSTTPPRARAGTAP